ncbi:hypothetical protein MVEN_00146600 [Mycena venus]|uniref:Uncharacterized protein n=1 Tax=Mycena venus TaxID=2733690 RepID=A0A8H6YMX4_9AGAR|nr:hypothetical protein MVEN_00642700 [Mycena venus]KAF7368260.1 hypothetical protein MVEN_00146600 [Mycena venus]
MSSLATFCDVPVSTGFEGHFATCRVSLEWVVNYGLPTHNSQVSGLLTLPCDAGVVSMFLNNVPVAASLASDLVLGLDWFNFVRSSAPELVVHLSSGVSLDVRRPPISTVSTTESRPLSSTATLAVASVSRAGACVEHSSSSLPVSLGGSDVLLVQPGRPVRGVSKHLVREVVYPVRGVLRLQMMI